jgi:hypothetical protein
LAPFGELGGGDVGAAEVELGVAAVERAVADEDEPEGEGGVVDLRLVGEDGLEALLVVALLVVGGLRGWGGVAADGDEAGVALAGGVGPAVGPGGELAAVFGLAFGADDEDDGGGFGGARGGGGVCEGDGCDGKQKCG